MISIDTQSSLPYTDPVLPDSFDHLLASSHLPPPGPDLYHARRKLWLTPRPTTPPLPLEPSTSRQRLEKLLAIPGAVERHDVWNNGIEKVWKGLAAGGRLKRRLPMSMIIKIVHSAWLRDDTWPMGAIAPEPDDELAATPVVTQVYPISAAATTEHSSGMTTPWHPVSGIDERLDAECPSGLVTPADH